MASASQQSSHMVVPQLGLLDLPADIHQLIVQVLKTREPLFPPRYGSDECLAEDDARAACEYYYGRTGIVDDESARALLNWSLTCRYFRHFVAPELYDTVVLENNPKSIWRVRELSQSPYWPLVHSLIFVTVHDPVEPDYEGTAETDQEFDDQIAQTIQSNMDDLASVLANFPPNLTSLTLDFQPSWQEAENPFVTTLWEVQSYDNDEKLAEAERLDSYRAQVKTAVTCVSQYDIASKTAFEFRLHNVTPFRCSAYDLPGFHTFLSNVTSFTFSSCRGDRHMDYAPNTAGQTHDFVGRLNPWFFDHLTRATHLNFHAHSTWPFGLAGGHNFLGFPLFEAPIHLPNLTHLSLEEFFIDKSLTRFMTSHFSGLESFTLRDCYACGDEIDRNEVNEDERSTWAEFFQALATHTDPRPSNLVFVSVTNPSSELGDLIQNRRRDQGKEIREILKMQRQEELARFRQEGYETCRDSVHRRRRRVLCYASLEYGFGFVHQEPDSNGNRFLLGQDYTEWLKLVDVVEENIKRATEKEMEAVGSMSISQRQQHQ